MSEKTPFTPGMKDIMRFARAEAGRLNHDYIGPEHYLLGIIRKGDGLAVQTLNNLDVDLDELEMEIDRLVGTGQGAPPLGIYNPTAEAKQIIEGSKEIAQQLKHSWIGTEHLLLSLIRAENTVASKCLRQFGVTFEKAQHEVLAVLDGSSTHTVRPNATTMQRSAFAEIAKDEKVKPLDVPSLSAPTEERRRGLRRLISWPGWHIRRQAIRAIGADFFEKQQRFAQSVADRLEALERESKVAPSMISSFYYDLLGKIEEVKGGLGDLTAHTGTVTENVRNLNRMMTGEETSGLRQASERLRDSISGIEQRLDSVWGSLDRMHGFLDEERRMMERFTPFFEQSRGPEETIKAQQQMYVKEFAGLTEVVDLGCGRGEFLDLLREAGVPAMGVDLDAALVKHCEAKGHSVFRADHLEWLSALPDASLGGIFCAQVIEHLPIPTVDRFVAQCARVLRPDGRLILETLNPTSLNIFMGPHWADPSHRHPIHPWPLTVICQTRGFMENRVVFSCPPPEEFRLPALESANVPDQFHATLERLNKIISQLNDSLYGPGQYAVIARRGRPDETGETTVQ